MSLWVDYAANCLWLDSTYPVDKSPSVPGVGRGPCPTTSGVPADVLSQSGGATVKYGNIRVGSLGSTTSVKPNPSSLVPTSRPSSSVPTSVPSTRPTTGPTTRPTTSPTTRPTTAPTTRPTTAPTTRPTTAPTTRPTSAPTSAPSPSAPSSGAVGAWGQCGGNNYSGSSTCVSGYTCKSYSEWYSQCIPN
ncbi:hypothetical protein LEN26_017209 [Aphanomyces euteiches]|nr:hypothetical protein LEN26_017209 [Aphanomyces euteiches]